MTEMVNWVLMVTSGITATGVLAILGFIIDIWIGQKEHDRALYGSEGNDSWNGLIPKVNRHEEILEEEDYL